MKNFEIEVGLENKRLVLQVEELDPWADEDGFIRYAVSGGPGRSVIALGQQYRQRPFIMTEADAWDYLEQLLYPEFSGIRSEDNVFTRAEQEAVACEIGRHVKQ